MEQCPTSSLSLEILIETLESVFKPLWGTEGRGHPRQDIGTLGAKTEGKAGLKKKFFPWRLKRKHSHPAYHLGLSSPRSCMPPHLPGV